MFSICQAFSITHLTPSFVSYSQGLLVKRDPREVEESLVRLVQLEPLAPQVLLELRERGVKQDFRDQEGKLDQQDLQDLREPLEHKVKRELQDPLVQLDPLVLQVKEVKPVIEVIVVILVMLEQLEVLEPEVHWGLLALLDLRVKRVNKDLRDQQGQLV